MSRCCYMEVELSSWEPSCTCQLITIKNIFFEASSLHLRISYSRKQRCEMNKVKYHAIWPGQPLQFLDGMRHIHLDSEGWLFGLLSLWSVQSIVLHELFRTPMDRTRCHWRNIKGLLFRDIAWQTTYGYLRFSLRSSHSTTPHHKPMIRGEDCSKSLISSWTVVDPTVRRPWLGTDSAAITRRKTQLQYDWNCVSRHRKRQRRPF